MNDIAVKCVGIKKSYGEKDNRVEALKGVDLEIHQGQLTLLVGPSGSGKTTLLSIISTILSSDEGELYLFDHEIHKMTELEKARFRRDSLGIVFQSLFLIPTLTVLENVSLPLLVAGYSQHQANLKALNFLEQLKMAHRSQVSPAFLSKGQQQRVAIARAMVNDSKIIVCDEPTSALDQAAGFEAMTLLHDLASKHSKAVLVVTHDHRIFPFANRIVEMSDGQIIKGDKHE
ncbi:putative ABC transporter, ATPase subunit [Candidatus Protochlamydia naegleriophila]|uniref:Putative ABC transporter, ATPase subunit n=1 Tax=Candidatus Protochlamydia naegleriophila TaxID=389348 RepID=A0A0U5EQ80_9BACT|nr:ABC transporter ATP-binding protein [Candidatus Protochlamydia naegleriophila]CUI16291.1 putative ABC transporter, ATPase subunit [Candidatus Protochlamydia naegleriophila]